MRCGEIVPHRRPQPSGVPATAGGTLAGPVYNPHRPGAPPLACGKGRRVELLVRNARVHPTLERGAGLFDVAVEDGRVAAVEEAGRLTVGDARELDAEGW